MFDEDSSLSSGSNHDRFCEIFGLFLFEELTLSQKCTEGMKRLTGWLYDSCGHKMEAGYGGFSGMIRCDPPSCNGSVSRILIREGWDPAYREDPQILETNISVVRLIFGSVNLNPCVVYLPIGNCCGFCRIELPFKGRTSIKRLSISSD